jgi:hypothetical protein
VTIGDVRKMGGDKLLDIYEGSFGKAVSSIYPEHTWQIWQFAVSKSFWDNVDNVKSFMDWLSKELQISSLEDWYDIPVTQISNMGGSTLLEKYGKGGLLSLVYPEHKWSKTNPLFSQKSQKYLSMVLHDMFPMHPIFTNFRMSEWEARIAVEKLLNSS